MLAGRPDPSRTNHNFVTCRYTVGSRGEAVDLIAYVRVSTQRQQDSGLGIDAQRDRVLQLAHARGDRVVKWFTEIESGRRSGRPELGRAMIEARRRGAVVVVAKLDRLARDAELVLCLAREAERNGFRGLLFADLPDIDSGTAAGRMVLSVMASVAEFESRRIGERTKEALAQAKARGKKLGGLRPSTLRRNDRARDAAAAASEKLRGMLEPLHQAQPPTSYRQMAHVLYGAGITTRNGERLSASQIRRHLQRLGLMP